MALNWLLQKLSIVQSNKIDIEKYSLSLWYKWMFLKTNIQ
jgi:hypothetical protein